MGFTKRQMMEDEERGWSSSNSFVCNNCIDTPFLKSLVTKNAVENSCDFCGSTSSKPIAAHLDILMEAIYGTLTYYFTDSSSANFDCDDGDYFSSTTTTAEALFDLDLSCSANLMEQILDSINSDLWFERGSGESSWSRQNKILSYTWRDFERKVKHRTRYFFHRPSSSSDDDLDNFEPQDILGQIAGIIIENGLIKTLKQGLPLFRCRLISKNDNWECNANQLGAPPNILARAGRMNPAGISYFYTALRPSTAIAETVGHPPVSFVLSKFTNARQITVVDLCNLPEYPPIFDVEAQSLRERIIFLYDFRDAISRPISKDGSEHIDYVPSQVVSEYFAQLLKIDDDQFGVDGVIYPSTVMKGGANLVLFPNNRRLTKEFDFVELVDFVERELNNWDDLTNSLFPENGEENYGI